VFEYDGVGNPTRITDLTSPFSLFGAPWPTGAKPGSKGFTYDDAYRLSTVRVDYGVFGDDAFVSPLAAERQRGDTTFPQLAGAPNRLRQETFEYDWMGNTTKADDDAHLADRSPGVVVNGGGGPHQLMSATQGGATVTPTYDAAGNVVQLEITRTTPCAAACPTRYQYFWDEVGNLAAAQRFDSVGTATRRAVTVTYAYDAGGSRVLKSVTDPAAGSVSHTADVFGTLRLKGAVFPDVNGDYEHTARTERVYLVSGAGSLGRAQFVDHDLPSGASGRLRVFLELGDHLGSTSFVIDKETGELVERPTYAAFGASESDYRPDRWASFREAYRYTGHADDVEVGLTYFGARYYAPDLGRWLSPDPLAVHAMAGDANAYAFVHGSPMRFVDPTGLDECDPHSQSCQQPQQEICAGICISFGGGGSGGTGGDSGSGIPRADPFRDKRPPPPPPPPDPGVPVTAADAVESSSTATGYYIPDNTDRYWRNAQISIAVPTAIAIGFLGGEAFDLWMFKVLIGAGQSASAIETVGAAVGAGGVATKAMETMRARPDVLATEAGLLRTPAAQGNGTVATLRVARPLVDNGRVIGSEFKDLVSGSPSIQDRLAGSILANEQLIGDELHAEWNLAVKASQSDFVNQGWQPIAGGVSPNMICPMCASAIKEIGGQIVGRRAFWFPPYQ
jgi:RHS repeat-associated protein